MAATASTPLILFSGLAADASVFVPQKIAFPQLTVPKWPIPYADETLTDYCERLAAELDNSVPFVLGGASFGGIVAQEVAQFVKPSAIVLIGSIRSPSELPLYARCCRPIRFLIPLIPVRLFQFLLAPAATTFAQKIAPHLCGLVRQFRSSNPTVFKWSLARILDWDSIPDFDCPVFHIHGDRDFVLPARRTQPDRIVAGGGHVISLTHPSDVNEFLRLVVDKIGHA